MIHGNSLTKYKYFTDLLQTVSYRGFRCIAYGYKQIKRDEVEAYLNVNRDYFMKDINMLGFLVF